MRHDNATSFDFSDFLLDVNTVYGVCFSVTDYAVSMRYTHGANSYSNADLQLDFGIGRGVGDFSGNLYGDRTWNGTLYYTAQTSVPEPSILTIFALGIIGLAARKYKKIIYILRFLKSTTYQVWCFFILCTWLKTLTGHPC